MNGIDIDVKWLLKTEPFFCSKFVEALKECMEGLNDPTDRRFVREQIDLAFEALKKEGK